MPDHRFLVFLVLLAGLASVVVFFVGADVVAIGGEAGLVFFSSEIHEDMLCIVFCVLVKC